MDKKLIDTIMGMNLDQLRSVSQIIQDRKDQLAIQNRQTLRVGDSVTVNHPKAHGIKFIVVEIRRVKATVKSHTGISYTVPLSLIS
jgi:hypothetical protein